jgi:hypothetical protein
MMWKEAAVAYYPGSCLEWLKKNTKITTQDTYFLG